MDFLFGSKIVASLDIGQENLKWAAIDQRKGSCHVWQAEMFPERSNRKDILEEDAVIKRLATLVPECQKAVPVWNKKVICTAYGSKVFYGYLEFGKTNTKYLKQAVVSGLLNTLPYPLDELEVKVTGVETLSGRSDHSAAFYGLVHKSLVEKLRRRVEACGLTLEDTSLIPNALSKAWGKNRGSDSGEFVALVNIGFEKTMVVVAKSQQPFSVREVPIGGSQFTYSFQIEEQLTWKAAEEKKRAYNVFESREHFVEPDLRKWLDELKKSIGHFESKFGEWGHKVAKVVLSGGGACWQGLDKRIEEFLKLPVLVDGWGDIRPVEPRSEQEALLQKISIGSCLK